MVHKEEKMRLEAAERRFESCRESGWALGVSREGGLRLCDVQNPRSHQLPGEPVQPLVEARAAASVAALDVPAPPAAQLVEAQQLGHLLHRHGAGDVLRGDNRLRRRTSH